MLITAKILILSLFLPLCASAAQLNLPKDAGGWTVFTPSADSTIVYVADDGNDTTCVGYLPSNELIGSDPFNPVGAVQPCLTPAGAYSKTHANMPDWILFKRGDTFTDPVGSNFRSGRGATEPFLVGAYGSSGASPLFIGSTSGASYNNSFSWIALSGLSFYADIADPDSPNYLGSPAGDGFSFQVQTGETAQGLLIEGCKFRFFEWNNIGVSTYNTGTFDGATIRRTAILDTYTATGTSSSSLWSWGIDNLVVEECVFDHNGWYDDYTGTIGAANAFSHSAYFSNNQNITFKNSIVSRSTGLKFISNNAGGSISGNDITGNLLLDNTVQVAVGINPGDPIRVLDTNISNNVFYNTGLINHVSTTAKWDIEAAGWQGATISSNLFLNSEVVGSNGITLKLSDNMIDIDIVNNVVLGHVDTPYTVSHQIDTAGTGASNITVSGNKFEASGNYQKYVSISATIPSSEYTFTNNTWYSPTAATIFRINGADATEAQWLSSYEPTATITQPDYPDRTRNIPTYMTSIGMTNTVDAFIAAARNQDRYDWDARLTADPVNRYLHRGFGLGGKRSYLYGAGGTVYGPAN